MLDENVVILICVLLGLMLNCLVKFWINVSIFLKFSFVLFLEELRRKMMFDSLFLYFRVNKKGSKIFI